MRILHNYQLKATFIVQDEEILCTKYDLISFSFSPSKKIYTPISFMSQLWFLFYNYKKYDLIFSQMAGYHTFLPSVLSYLGLKKHLIVLHGTDSLTVKEIGYGNLGRPLLSWFTRFSIKYCDHLLPVSESLIYSVNEYLYDKPRPMGVKTSIPNLKTPYSVIHNGISDAKFSILKNCDRKSMSFITVGSGLDASTTYYRKGIDLILNAAIEFPQYTFTIVGCPSIYNYDGQLKNLKIIGRCTALELCTLYNQNHYYLQVSMVEGFGVSLCEAMLCGCIPIVSASGMMPEIIGTTGYILHKKSNQEFTSLILSLDTVYETTKGQASALHIAQKYPVARRSEKLLTKIETT